MLCPVVLGITVATLVVLRATSVIPSNAQEAMGYWSWSSGPCAYEIYIPDLSEPCAISPDPQIHHWRI